MFAPYPRRVLVVEGGEEVAVEGEDGKYDR